MFKINTNNIIEEVQSRYTQLSPKHTTLTPIQKSIVESFAEQYLMFSKGINDFIIKDFKITRSDTNNNVFFLNNVLCFNMKFNRHMNTSLYHEGWKNPHSLFSIHSESIFDERFDFSNIDISIEIKDKTLSTSIKNFILSDINNINYDFKKEIKSSMICFSTIKSILKSISRDIGEENLDNLYPLFSQHYDKDMITKFNEIKEILLLQYDLNIEEDINNLNDKIHLNIITHLNKSKFIC